MFSIFVFFFFSSRRRHTRFDCDWSSDVCSSDLVPSTPLACTCLTVCPRRLLPADAEAQEVRPAQQAKITPGVVEAEPEVPPPIREPAAYRDTVLRKTPGACPGGLTPETDVVDVVVRLYRVARPSRQRKPRVTDIRDRKSVVKGKSVDLGGGRIIKKKNKR